MCIIIIKGYKLRALLAIAFGCFFAGKPCRTVKCYRDPGLETPTFILIVDFAVLKVYYNDNIRHVSLMVTRLTNKMQI